jgi:Family of unknown function (DUF5678)
MQISQHIDPEVEEDLARYQADADYFNAHRDELLSRYPEQWVAVYKQEVVGTAKNMNKLVKKLEKRGIRPGRTYREFLTHKDELLILPAQR